MLRVAEIFHSIQGETTRAGLPCAFVRLAGCDVDCAWCDTRYATETPGEPLSVDAILHRLGEAATPLAVVTGGEPLLQAETPALVERLLPAYPAVLVETSGTRDIDVLPAGAVRIVDAKPPSSGATARMDWANLDRLRPSDELKIVLADEADYRWARDLVRERRLHERCPVLFGAVHDRLDPAHLAAWILRDRLPVRLQLQLHRLLWPDRERGV